MKALVINLKSAPERKEFQQFQLNQLGIDFQFVNAQTADNAPSQRSEKYWRTGVRLLKDTEKACFLSHRTCWENVIQSNKPMLIIEDDALLSIKTPTLLSDIQELSGIDILNLETRGRRILIKKNSEQLSGLYRLFLNRDGAAAYILWPSGARKLIAKTDKAVCIADAALWTNFHLQAYQANPALALQSDTSHIYGMPPPFETKSTIAATKPNQRPSGIIQYLRYRFRRCQEQLDMALPQILNYLTAEKKHLDVNKADFDYLKGYSE